MNKCSPIHDPRHLLFVLLSDLTIKNERFTLTIKGSDCSLWRGNLHSIRTILFLPLWGYCVNTNHCFFGYLPENNWSSVIFCFQKALPTVPISENEIVVVLDSIVLHADCTTEFSCTFFLFCNNMWFHNGNMSHTVQRSTWLCYFWCNICLSGMATSVHRIWVFLQLS